MTVTIAATSSLRLADMVIPDHLGRDLRRAEEFIQLAVLASQEVLSAAEIDGQRTGIYLGTAFGPMECNFSVLDDLVMDELISPTFFSHSVFNAASGYISRICKIYGPALTVTSYGWPFFTALQTAWQAITEESISHALVLQIETYSSLLHDARTAMLPDASAQWPAGATAWLLSRQGPCLLDNVTILEIPCPPEARLARQETWQPNSTCHPLAAVEELSALIARNVPPQKWQTTAAYGEVKVSFSKNEHQHD